MTKEKKKIEFLPMNITNSPMRKDIVGDAGKFVDDFICAMESEKIYNVMGVNPDKSFLITGSPGNGKTMAIESLVNEVNKEIYKKVMDYPEMNEKLVFDLYGFKYDTGKYGTAYINQGSKIVQGFFDTCFNVANHGYKTLVIFDEAETLFGHRTDRQSHKEDSKVLETIMKNMQVLHNTDNMYAVMMSNFPEAFDKASIRAGRVDKRYEFKNPNSNERRFAYNHVIGRINEKAGYKVIRGYDIDNLASISDGFSYSDVVESVNSGVKKRAKEISHNRTDKIIVAGYIGKNRLENAVHTHKNEFIIENNSRKMGFI